MSTKSSHCANREISYVTLPALSRTSSFRALRIAGRGTFWTCKDHWHSTSCGSCIWLFVTGCMDTGGRLLRATTGYKQDMLLLCHFGMMRGYFKGDFGPSAPQFAA
ncbi:hypothetical protein N431DRAFT_431833 [Stipitochalara longipes BDJ]|nr:hypothetical protein N431DRAFT_431833 [Stipitochalara longipes BDJ]